MILPPLLILKQEFSLFQENFSFVDAWLKVDDFFLFFDLNSIIPSAILSVPSASENSAILIDFINQLEDLSLFSDLDNVTTVYHYSIPVVKLAYPEPFVAGASFMHSDLWFIHILIYQYWLWFAFVFIIVFFFVVFMCTLRWCNTRIRPRRETRGVSRSKCGDLITCCVPVSWAASIIISESTDAIDYYDGFGTTELVVGIRAFQWGWEYYYPKDLDLNYNIRPNYASFVGNSLKYTAGGGFNFKNQ